VAHERREGRAERAAVQRKEAARGDLRAQRRAPAHLERRLDRVEGEDEDAPERGAARRDDRLRRDGQRRRLEERERALVRRRVAKPRERRGEQRDPEALVEAGHAALAVEVAHRREEAGARGELDVDRRPEPHEQQHLEDHGRGAGRAAAERGAARLPEERRAGPPPRGRAPDLHGVRRLALGHVARAEASERDGCVCGLLLDLSAAALSIFWLRQGNS